MDARTVNLVATLFIATFTVTAVLWLALWASGQASVNVISGESNAPSEEVENGITD